MTLPVIEAVLVQTARRADLVAVPAPLPPVGPACPPRRRARARAHCPAPPARNPRARGKRPRYATADRALLAAASRLLPPGRWSSFAVSTTTLRRWHRALLLGDRRAGPRRVGRPPLAAETRSLIACTGEPQLGLYAHPGGAEGSRDHRLGDDGREPTAQHPSGTCAAANRPQLARVPARSSREPGRQRSAPRTRRWSRQRRYCGEPAGRGSAGVAGGR
jgi:hypothetical protein